MTKDVLERFLLRALVALVLGAVVPPLEAADEQAFVFETWNHQKVEAFRGSFTVPENREAPNSRLLTLHYVRLPSTGPAAGPPIVYLAGGPGGSGIEAINYRYRMFMDMRSYGDVIALDQRGTGESNSAPTCQSSQVVPVDRSTSDVQFNDAYRAALRECFRFWREKGVDVGGYNTRQNVSDLDALRQHLGSDNIVLWGTSYGGHLALAALKQMSTGISKVVISSVRGLDDTIKLPIRTEQYLTRLQAAVNTQPRAAAAYRDIEKLMRRVHAKLERKPVGVILKSRSGATVSYLLQRRDLQLLAANMLADPRSAARLLLIYDALDRGVDPGLTGVPGRFLPDNLSDPTAAISLNVMPVAMDLASGMSVQRRVDLSKQVKTALFGRYFDQLGHFVDSDYRLDAEAAALDLGDSFRSPVTSDVPVLLLSGTLDGRTDILSQLAAVSALRNVTKVTVQNAGHNLFDEPSDDIRNIIREFLTGRPVQDTTVSVSLPDFASQP